ncbi:hypothetical protein JTE90_022633 [Oedothorax gibbosus]|uniref:Uncharacterized protein n=1 Tax=Oedothorax gibbosus TaxID=931172 RepID=A0AAV6TTJ8_9ARAC|nr:hypothetical protein JTE90_022633 [Oedothorax gibbosus]
MILDLADLDFDPWSCLRFFRFETISMNAQQPFIQALKLLFKSEAPMTVFCQNESWSALLGNTKFIMPVNEVDAKFQLYATPYFVKDPSSIAEHMQGISHATSDNVFMYKHGVLYLDHMDVPFPGGCYLDASVVSGPLYRICFLSREPLNKALAVATEWKSRRDVLNIPFLTKETLANPTMIPALQPIAVPYLPDNRVVSVGSIQKRLSMNDPSCLIQDVLHSYRRNHPDVQNVGIVMDWPFRLTFEGTRPNASSDKECVALSVNGVRPTKTLHVRYPYDVYTEYDQVPAIPWTLVNYHPVILELPLDMVKVSVDSIVLGYVYKNGFYCFNYPVMEGRPTHESARNVKWLLSPVKQLDVAVQETFRIDEKYALNRIQRHGIPAWCITQADDTHKYPQKKVLAPLVEEWLNLFCQQMGKPPVIDVKMIQMALTLARHKVCFKIKIKTDKRKVDEILLNDNEIEMVMTRLETNFINSVRVREDEEENNGKEEGEGCKIM